MKGLNAGFFAALVLVAFSISGCESSARSRGKAPLVDSVSLTLMTDKEVRVKYGSSTRENPFLRRAGTLTGTPYDYFDAKLSLVTEGGATVEILEASVTDKEGKARAWLYDRAQFVDIVTRLSNPDDLDSISRRQNIANWYYVPARSFTLKRGSYEYVLVFLGQHPVPEDLKLYARLSVNGEEHEFSLDLPNQK